MTQPRVPGSDDGVALPCGETVPAQAFDLGMREYSCDCGDVHAVVMDSHPLARFVPEFFVETLRETTETDDEFEAFGTPHALAMVREEFPDQVVSADRSGEGSVGYALLWVAEFDSRRLHEVVVDLLVEMVAHAVSHADDTPAVDDFESQLQQFDIDEFVDLYRAERSFDDEFDTAL